MRRNGEEVMKMKKSKMGRAQDNPKKITLSEATGKVIDLARKVREYYDAELPKRHPDYPLERLGDERTPPPKEEEELRQFLGSLSDNLVAQLILIMYLGRGDYAVDNLAENYEAFTEAFANREHAISQMMAKAPLADYLTDGLETLRMHRIDVDHLPLQRIKMPKH
jgi:hypothetical protein